MSQRTCRLGLGRAPKPDVFFRCPCWAGCWLAMALARHLRLVVVPGRSQPPPSAPSGSTPALRALWATSRPSVPHHDRQTPTHKPAPRPCAMSTTALPLPPQPPATATWNRPGGIGGARSTATPRGEMSTEQAGWLSWGSGNFRPPRLRCLTIAHGRCHQWAVSSEHRARISVRCGPCLRFVLPSGYRPDR